MLLRSFTFAAVDNYIKKVFQSFKLGSIHCSHLLNVSWMGAGVLSNQHITLYDSFISSRISFCKVRADCFFDFFVSDIGLLMKRVGSDLNEYLALFKKTLLINDTNQHSAVGYEDSRLLLKCEGLTKNHVVEDLIEKRFSLHNEFKQAVLFVLLDTE